MAAMSPAPRKPSVIGSLPNTRPHRRSARRPAVDPATVAVEGPPVSGQGAAPPASPAAPKAKAQTTKAQTTKAQTTKAQTTKAQTTKANAKARTEAEAKPGRSAAKAAPPRPSSQVKPGRSAGRAAPRRASSQITTEPPRMPAPTQRTPESPGALGTAVQAAAELAEIGLQVGARALRRTLDRLPRP
jgi:hypothetical protein